MNKRVINMLESIKFNKYYNYLDYLSYKDIEEITEWYNSFSITSSTDFEKAIDLMYELYIREDIDLKTVDEYTTLISYLSDKYQLNKALFLTMYSRFKELLYR